MKRDPSGMSQPLYKTSNYKILEPCQLRIRQTLYYISSKKTRPRYRNPPDRVVSPHQSGHTLK